MTLDRFALWNGTAIDNRTTSGFPKHRVTEFEDMMSEPVENRLDRLEALAGEVLEGLREVKEDLREVKEGLREAREGIREARDGIQETRRALQETNQNLQETRAIANSNAKSIQALSDNLAESKKEWERDRQGLYQLLGQLTRSMSDFYHVQSDFYNRFDQIEARQARMNEILDRYLPPDNPRT